MLVNKLDIDQSLLRKITFAIVLSSQLYSTWVSKEQNETERLCIEACKIAKEDNICLNREQVNYMARRIGFCYQIDFNQSYEFHCGMFGGEFIVMRDDGLVTYRAKFRRSDLEEFVDKNKKLGRGSLIKT